MRKRVFALMLVLLWTLSGCGAAEVIAKGLAEDIANQWKYVDNGTGSAESGKSNGGTDSTKSTEPTAQKQTQPSEEKPSIDGKTQTEKARQAYDAMLEPYQESTTAQSLITDIDGDGIPELILIKDDYMTVGTGSKQYQTMRMFYSVYTYQNGSVKALISQRVTHAAPAAGSYITIGIDRIDNVPVVVAVCRGETTGNRFGDAGYEGEIDVEALDPFTGKVYSELHQELEDDRITAQWPNSNFSAEVGRYMYVKLDANGVISFQPKLATQRIWRNNEQPWTKSSESGPTEIKTAADLEKIRNDPDGEFILTKDITLGSSGLQTIKEFNGTLDGQGHWIRGLRIQADGESVSGLFGSIGEKAVIKDLSIDVTAEMSIPLSTTVSGLAESSNGVIQNCTVQSDVRFTAGADGYSTFMLRYVPIAYLNNSKIENCTLKTKASGSGYSDVCGVAGENNGKITGCKIEITSSGCNYISGLAYRNWEDVSGCTVSVTAEDIDGFTCTASQNFAAIKNCRFTARLTPRAGESLSWSVGSDMSGGSFDSSNTVQVVELENEADKSPGSGTKSDPYKLRKAEDLELLRTKPNAYYKLIRDIDFAGREFSPLGEFGGYLDGNGHAIRGITYQVVPGQNNNAAALIRNLSESACVENLTVHCSLDGEQPENNDGAGIAICNAGTIRNCSVSVTAANFHAVGGITRNNTAGAFVENCSVSMTTDGCTFVGGVAEYQSGTVSDCTAALQINGVTCLGGISYANAGKIQNCTANGTVHTDHTNGYLAALVGENLKTGTISGSTATVKNDVRGTILPLVGNQ